MTNEQKQLDEILNKIAELLKDAEIILNIKDYKTSMPQIFALADIWKKIDYIDKHY